MRTRNRRLIPTIALYCLSLLLSNALLADPQSKAFSQWTFQGSTASVIYTIPSREVSRIPEHQNQPDLSALLTNHLGQTLAVMQNGQPCKARPPEKISAKPGYERVQVSFDCPGPLLRPTVTIQAMFAYSGSHVHFAKFKIEGRPVFEYLYTRGNPSYVIELQAGGDTEATPSTGAWKVFTSYIFLGFEHILAGIDHIAFLLTLLLMAGRLRDVLWIVTGFTIGHSITLSLAVLQLASPNIMMVEAMIGFTIALVAAENVAAQTDSSASMALVAASLCTLLAVAAACSRHGPPVLSLLGLALFCLCYLNLSDSKAKALSLRPAITTLFGTIHGFGFASVLMEVGLPQQRILSALFGFNIGVELGQIAIVLGISTTGLVLMRWLLPRSITLGSELLSAALCGLGCYWFVQRGFFA
jgi:hypothetical protein